MTCIVGITHNGGCWLGSDSVVTYDDTRIVAAEPKVRAVGGYVVGWSGGLREANIAATWQAPRYDGRRPLWWLVQRFVPCWLKALKKAQVTSPDLWLLLGLAGELWSIGSSGSVHSWSDGYGAIGSGSDVALGVLECTSGKPRRRIKAALRAAARYDPTRIGPPWHLVHC